MDRHHKWIAAIAALTSSAWLAVTVIGGPPLSSDAPVIQLMAPEFDDSNVDQAPSPAPISRDRGAVSSNRPLGLGFPGPANVPPKALASGRSRSSAIQRVQATDSQPKRIELPVHAIDENDPPPPHGNVRSEHGQQQPTPRSEELLPEGISADDNSREEKHEPAPRVPTAMRDTPSELRGTSHLSPPYIPANQDPDALPWTAPFEDRIARAPEHEEMDTRADDLSELPADYIPWWIGELSTLVRPNKTAVPVDVDTLVSGALQFSPQILGFRTQPEIANSVLGTENAALTGHHTLSRNGATWMTLWVTH